MGHNEEGGRLHRGGWGAGPGEMQMRNNGAASFNLALKGHMGKYKVKERWTGQGRWGGTSYDFKPGSGRS